MLRCVRSAGVASVYVRCVSVLCVHVVYTVRGARMMKWLLVCVLGEVSVGGRYACSLRCVYMVRCMHTVFRLRGAKCRDVHTHSSPCQCVLGERGT